MCSTCHQFAVLTWEPQWVSVQNRLSPREPAAEKAASLSQTEAEAARGKGERDRGVETEPES